MAPHVDGELMVNDDFDAETKDVEECQITKPPWYAIDTFMIPSKVAYIFQQAKDSSYKPYMNLFLISTGLTPVQAGQINGLRFLGAIVGAPLWGLIADLKKAHRRMITLLCICAVLTLSTQPLISIAITGTNTDSCSDYPQNISGNATEKDPFMFTESKTPNNNILFIVLMLINIIAASFDGSTIGFIDSGVMNMINNRERKTKFGKQRLFGEPGYGLGTLLSSIFVQYFPKYGLPCYSAMLFVYGLITMCLAISSNILYKGIEINPAERKPKIGKLLSKTLMQFHVLFFLMTVLVVGIVHGFYLCYLFILLKEINTPNLIMGLSIVAGAISAMQFLYFLEKIIRIVGGTLNMLFIACLSWGIRLLLTSYIHNPYLILPIQLFQGIGFGLFLGAGVTHIKAIASQEIYSSMYGVFYGLFFGAGMIIANVTGGIILSQYGIRWLFVVASLIAFSWSICMLFYILFIKYATIEKQDKEKEMMVLT
jgi:PPP family 3-phenylpropionic acid transporter